MARIRIRNPKEWEHAAYTPPKFRIVEPDFNREETMGSEKVHCGMTWHGHVCFHGAQRLLLWSSAWTVANALQALLNSSLTYKTKCCCMTRSIIQLGCGFYLFGFYKSCLDSIRVVWILLRVVWIRLRVVWILLRVVWILLELFGFY